ncbi:MAG: N-acetylmuramoyl-L-alanine amidase [Clostridia bacterium]|nr:N-acetylmuramoyl-L-alanine amidase [Clostridia bacterium]
MRNTAARGLMFLLLFVFFASLLALSSFAVNSKGQIVIVLDPGHFEGDSGGTFAGTHHESWYNWQVATACMEYLKANGNFEVHLTHETNQEEVNLAQRASVADSCNADMFISFHFDGSGSSLLSGPEALVSVFPEYSRYTEPLALKMLSGIQTFCGLESRGIFRRYDSGDGKHLYYWDGRYRWDVPDVRTAEGLSDYYGVITWGAKLGFPAFILEHAFLTNKSDLAFSDDPDNLRVMGYADALAIINYYSHEHVWSESRETDYESNCCMRGKASYRCSICGARKGTVFLQADPGRHFYYAVRAVSPTCTTDGYTVYRCRYEDNLTDKGYPGIVSQETEYKVTVPAWGHDYIVTEDTPLTHTQDGIQTKVCTRCSDTVTVIQKAAGHRYVKGEERPATCTEDGYRSFVCPICGDTQGYKIPATGHRYVLTEDTAPTCSEDGIMTETCSLCGDTVTEIFAAESHYTVFKSRTLPTCTLDGTEEHECVKCGKLFSYIIPKAGHSYGTWGVCKSCGEMNPEMLKAILGAVASLTLFLLIIIPSCRDRAPVKSSSGESSEENGAAENENGDSPPSGGAI